MAIYSRADGPNALHARMADEAFLVGTGPTPGQSYLLQSDILEIADQVNATAIHPGYGFLSENAGFAESVQRAGMVFIGPPPSAIQAMGSKSQAKAIMQRAGVPTTPGFYGDDHQEPGTLLEEARKIGFPVLIKAVMGGGGKGMRLVWSEEDFLPALEACQRESQAAFANGAVLLEKYLVKPRHVEVQVVADAHGNVVSLHERDCSLQRRHQKIIEEAPAVDLPTELRARLGKMGRRAAQAVGYVNAGTVEFLLDTQQPEHFYFCEMNTRLQVEHPVTESITGIDLVEWQLRIAAGEELPIKDQADIPCVGHSFEARIYAENPARNFLPATGVLWHHRPPTTINTGLSDDGIRVDTGLQEGQEVGMYYDPMISKLIVHGNDRPQALRKLVAALKAYQIAGVPSNIEFLVKCAEHPTFAEAGAINTGFLDDYAADVKMDEQSITSDIEETIGAFAMLLYLEKRIGAAVKASLVPWSSRSGSWRLGGETGRAERIFQLENGETLVCVSNTDGSFDVCKKLQNGTENRHCFHVDGYMNDDGSMEVVLNRTQRISLTAVMNIEHEQIKIHLWSPQRLLKNFTFHIKFRNPLIASSRDSLPALTGEGLVKSPMPGTVRRILCNIGDHVTNGQVIMVLEAMKMEHSIKALRDGVLAEICTEIGDVVKDGSVLFVVGNRS